MKLSCTLQGIVFPTVEIDFIGDVITVTLPHPGGGSRREVKVEIPLIDDVIVELTELFLGYIEIVNAVDIGTIVLGRHTIELGILQSTDSKKDLKLTYYKNDTYPHGGFVLCQDHYN